MPGTTKVLFADPRVAVQERLEYGLASQGYVIDGPRPDLVLTPDAVTARSWSRKGVPVWCDGDGAPPALGDGLAMAAQLPDADDRPLPH